VDFLGNKDPSLRELVAELTARMTFKSFILVDGWGDQFAIGLGSPSRPNHVAYVSSERDVHGRYFMSREKPSDNDLDLFQDSGSNWFSSVDSLARAVEDHLRAA
jgi:hypothetical protein